MKTGIVLGKFMPLHKGHLELIRYARTRCDRLIVLLCVAESEIIPGDLRELWLTAVTESWPNVEVRRLDYDENIYPNTSVSSWTVSQKWGELLRRHFLELNAIFTSEPYGGYLAEIMGIEAEIFDLDRKRQPVSATMIREQPEKHWDFLPEIVRPYFVNTVCLVGTESTGKSTLTKRLAARYCFDEPPGYVLEAGRDLAPQTEECTFETLSLIAETHARRILDATKQFRKRLFVDTDLVITQSYAKFLFGKTLNTAAWVKAANRFKTRVYLDRLAPYVQDGTRLNRQDRDRLDEYHREEFTRGNIPLLIVTGKTWHDREANVIKLLDHLI